MKVCILGATGKSGRQLVRAASERGHAITALVRDSGRAAALARTNVTVRAVDSSDEGALQGAIEGHDVVINAAGYVGEGEGFTSLVQRIIRASERALGPGGRFWTFAGAALLDVPGTSVMTMDLPGVPKIFRAHRANYEAARATHLDWSFLCPGPMIESPNGQPTEGLIVSKDCWPVSKPLVLSVLPRFATSLAFRSALPRLTIYYEDAASVILDNLAAGETSRRRIGIALPKGEVRHKPNSTTPAETKPRSD